MKKEHLSSYPIFNLQILAFVIGISIPTLIGWLIIRMIEGQSPVLFTLERWVLALVLGTTGTMFIFFITESIGILKFTRSGFLLVCTLFLITLGWLFMYIRVHWKPITLPVPNTCKPLSNKMKLLVVIITVWIIVKIIAAAALAIGSPPYLDDTLSNWNMRGKAYFINHEMVLSLDKNLTVTESSAGVFSYPPTVPLFKTWLCALYGKWSEGLANAPHVIWYIASLLLMFFFLRRQTSFLWALAGAYILSSLPIYLIHGSQSYADLFVSLHVFAALSLLYNAVSANTEESRISFLRLSGLSAALMIFTKNEALLIHFPIYAALFLSTVIFMVKKDLISSMQAKRTIIQVIIFAIIIVGPWLMFKWTHNLPFGNAKPISTFKIGWQKDVLNTLWINTFFEGNWIFLFPLLIGLAAIKFKQAFMSPVLIFTAFFVLAFGQQMALYMFTSLSTEALRQTGYVRGLIQLAPVAVGLLVMLLRNKAEEQ